MTVASNLPNRPLTLADVTRLAEADSSHRFELSEGNLVVMPPGPWRHQRSSMLMGAWLLNAYGDRVNAAPGVQTADDNLNGRIPDLVVTKAPVDDDTVWLDRAVVTLAVEIVSKGSERMDRWLKPIEYAEAGIPFFWRVEPDEGVVQFRLEDGRYVEYGKVPLEALLAGEVPVLS
ncbi:Uma2 family endonuclease [Dactylosporangium vinaceum]|uniref:Uma2 family endonuclease n=1 Tax=Dactylosporangium vinaceum TaxID=53362 RepID=A0ABV5M7F8_9ACTN|nr:Uma2 family endonuclease [Dactylosporangium vinaceum]UAB95343.1 Uma2 family endonuclease [Dactylosporangium vinaceum]